MKKGIIKVMVGRHATRIQEELDGQIKVYSAEDWKKELDRRETEGSIKLPELEKLPKPSKLKGIEVKEPAKAKAMPVKAKAKTAKPKGKAK